MAATYNAAAFSRVREHLRWEPYAVVPASTGLCGGWLVTAIPTATVNPFSQTRKGAVKRGYEEALATDP